jgi:hypothetical protein
LPVVFGELERVLHFAAVQARMAEPDLIGEQIEARPGGAVVGAGAEPGRGGNATLASATVGGRDRDKLSAKSASRPIVMTAADRLRLICPAS